MTQAMTLRIPALRTPELVAMTAFLMALNALAIDLMLPALDDIAGALGVTTHGGAGENRQQLVIFAYILGFGMPQVIFGPLSDRFGRRPVLLACLAGYSVVGAMCTLTTSFEALLVARFFQGVAASGVRVVAVSIIRDLHAGRGMARIMSLVMTVFMIVPILAPALGQLILYVAPWRWTFGVLVAAGIVTFLWVRLRLPETLPPERRRPLDWTSAMAAYAEVFRNRFSRGYLLASGLIFGALFAFIGSSEQIFREVFHQEDTFVLWFAGIAFTMSMASLSNSHLVERIGMRRLSHLALVGFVTISAILLTVMIFVGEELLLFFPLFAMIFACFGFIGSNFNAIAMEPLGHVAGSASAAFGFVSTTLSAAIGYLIGSQYDGSVVPVVEGFLALGIATFAVVALTEGRGLFGRRESLSA